MTSRTEAAGGARVIHGVWHGRRPEHPGRLLERCYLIPLHISQAELARRLGISRRRVNEIVNGQRAISADTALKLACFFRTSPMFWLERQQLWELYLVRRALR
jgi:addiction module HigA family antidote